MKRLLLPIALAAGLCGCSVVPPAAWSFDPTHPQPKPVADAAKLAPLTDRIAQLQGELNDVRGQAAQQPDTPHRMALYPREHDIGSELSPLQRELAEYAQAR